MWPILAAIGAAASKAIVLAGKGATMVGKGAIGMGKGIMGSSQASSPLALGKTAAPALNAGAMKAGNQLGVMMNSMGRDLGKNLLMSKMGGGGGTVGQTEDFPDIAPMQTASAPNAPTMAGQAAPIGVLSPQDLDYYKRMRGGFYG